MKKVSNGFRRFIYCTVLLIPAICFSGCSEDLYGPATEQQPPQPGAPGTTLAPPEITVSSNKNYYKTTETLNITMTAATGATITYYYNGDPSTATEYTGGFSINSGTSAIITVTAYATLPGYNDSATVTRNFDFEASGNIVTIAGGSTGGNNSYAIQAELFNPGQVCVVTATPLFYFTEAGLNRVRAIDNNSKIQAYAGTGTSGPTTDGTLATNATLSAPSGVCSDGVNTYIVDPVNNTVLQVNSTGNIRTVCSTANTNPSFHPRGICFDANTSSLYIADAGNNCIRSASVSGTTVSTASVIGGSFGYGILNPVAVCIDSSKTIFVVSDSENTVWRILDGGTATEFISSTVPIPAFSGPSGISVDGTNLYIADTGNHCIRRVSTTAIPTASAITRIAGTLGTPGFDGDRGSATLAKLNSPQGVFAHGGNVYIADTENNCIREILIY